MSARSAIAPLKRAFQQAASKGPMGSTRQQVRGMSGGSIEEEIAEYKKWRVITYACVPGCIAYGAYTFSNAEHGHAHEKIPFEYLKIRNKRFPW
eukprot:CAMPEP_0196570640 /NCGR_PEP_ID=MMETSP1081-20130531/777_1 /TAXON_ID=36882 /ORGANISM="Pyramimonas amylifera, Strain CCMP720" /LENGTH=93 /DNA_ID=CAMNT_0041887193 /DNA_START=88 /DNA_END=366 /DNA_ORIENTATION=+